VIFQVVKGERSPMNRSESKIENTWCVNQFEQWMHKLEDHWCQKLYSNLKPHGYPVPATWLLGSH
jgi:hypothetical protein